MQIFLILLSSGSLGFISYLTLRELGVLNFPLREKEIEKVTLIHFSIFNAIAVYFLYWLIFGVDLFRAVLDIGIFMKVIGLSVLAALVMPFLYWFLIRLAKKVFGKIQKNKNLITFKYKPLFDDLFLPNEYEDTFVIIFNFSNEFIHAGHLHRMEYKESKLCFSLYAAPYQPVYTFEKVSEMFHEEGRDSNKLKTVIDPDRGLKYFLMYDSNDGDE